MTLPHLINLFKLGLLHKKKNIIIQNNNNNYKIKLLINCLIKNNIILYTKNNKNEKQIFLQTNKKFNLKNLYKPSHKKTLTAHKLKKNYWIKTSSLYILSTSIGILTHHEAIKYQIGGIILFKIF